MYTVITFFQAIWLDSTKKLDLALCSDQTNQMGKVHVDVFVGTYEAKVNATSKIPVCGMVSFKL